MDGIQMTNQAAVDAGQEILQRIEKDMAALQKLLDAQETPFEDRKCNRRLRRLTKRWGRISEAVRDWHEDIEDCVSTGDVTVQFGGK